MTTLPLADLAGAASRGLELLVTALAHGTVLAVIGAALAATVLRRARPAVIAALWTVVLLKFVVPFGPGAGFSLASLAARVHPPAAAPAWVILVEPGPTVAPQAVVAGRPSLLPLGLAGAWLALAGVVLARQLRRHRAARQVALAAAPAPAWLDHEVRDLAARLGVRRPIVVRVSDGVAPYLIGVWAPVVVVPTTLLDPQRRSMRGAALIHELAHVRRGDAALRGLQGLAGALFFFWPVVRWINRRIDHARELACDAYAIAHGPLAAPAYARMLLDMVRARQAPVGSLALARRAHIGRRVEQLVTRPVAAGVGVPGALAIAGFAAVGLTGAVTAGADANRPTVCVFTPEIASAILRAHPSADVDGDGDLSRTEVCDYQHVLRRRAVDQALAGQPGAYASHYDLDGDGALGLAEESARREDLASVLPVSLLSDGTPLARHEVCCDCASPGEPGAASVSAGSPAFEPIPAISTCVRGAEP